MNFSVPPELATLEVALSDLQPVDAACDRDRLMFLAGQASALRSAVVRPWVRKVFTGFTIMATLLLGYGCWSLWQENSALRSLAQAAVSTPEKRLAASEEVKPDQTQLPLIAGQRVDSKSTAAPTVPRSLRSGPMSYVQLCDEALQLGIEGQVSKPQPVPRNSNSSPIEPTDASYASLIKELRLPAPVEEPPEPPAFQSWLFGGRS